MNKKIKIIFIFSILLLFLSSCSSKNTNNNNINEGNPSYTNEVNSTNNINNNEKEFKTNNVIENKATIKDTSEKESGMLSIFKSSFSGFANVEFNKEYKVYHIIPTDPNFENDAITIYNNSNDPELMKVWNELIYQFKDGSRLMQEELGDGYGVALVNPSNQDNYLILAKDGVIIYDFVRDGNH
ncbi:hypothetical protein ACYSNN_08345 [Peptoniphilus genitalis]